MAKTKIGEPQDECESAPATDKGPSSWFLIEEQQLRNVELHADFGASEQVSARPKAMPELTAADDVSTDHRRLGDQKSELSGTTPDDDQIIIELGREAANRLREGAGKVFDDWLALARAFEIGSNLAMHRAETNRPRGPGYNKKIREWLRQNELDKILHDRGLRSRLLWLMANLEKIQEWRQRLPDNELNVLNHPNTVWRKLNKKKRSANKPVNVEAMQAAVEELKAGLELKDQEIAKLQSSATLTSESEPGQVVDFLRTTYQKPVLAQIRDLLSKQIAKHPARRTAGSNTRKISKQGGSRESAQSDNK